MTAISHLTVGKYQNADLPPVISRKASFSSLQKYFISSQRSLHRPPEYQFHWTRIRFPWNDFKMRKSKKSRFVTARWKAAMAVHELPFPLVPATCTSIKLAVSGFQMMHKVAKRNYSNHFYRLEQPPNREKWVFQYILAKTVDLTACIASRESNANTMKHRLRNASELRS